MKARSERNALKQTDEPGWILIGQGLEKSGIHKCEDGHACADAKRQDEDRGCGKSRIFAQLPDGKSKILQCGLEAERHYVVTLLQSLRSVPELSACGVFCGFGGHIMGLKVFFRLLAVEGHFFSELAAELFAANENP